MAIPRQLPSALEIELGYTPVVWRKFHILSRVQVFVVSSLCAAVVAVPFAIASSTRQETAILRDLFWPHQLDPFITFGAVFLSLLPVFLGYYHLGRLGALLSLAVSAVTWYVMALCAFFVFSWHSAFSGTIAYVGACLLLYVVVFVVHIKVSDSRSIRDAQRSLRLVSNTRMP